MVSESKNSKELAALAFRRLAAAVDDPKPGRTSDIAM